MEKRFTSGFYRILAAVIGALCLLLFVFGLFFTIVYRQYEENDLPELVRTSPILAVLSLIAALGILWGILRLADPYLKNRSPRFFGSWRILIPGPGFAVFSVLLIGFCAFLIAVIRGLPTNDAGMLHEITQQFLRGDYSDIDRGYLVYCPHQLSYCLLSGWIMRLSGEQNMTAFQVCNAVSIWFTMFFLYEITWELFEDLRVLAFWNLIGTGFLALYVYVTYIYNDIWSMGPLFGALYFWILFLKRNRPGPAVPAVLLASLSFFIKTNGLIALIAMGMTGVFLLPGRLKEKKYREAAVIVASVLGLVFLPLLSQKALNGYYEAVSGYRVAAGEPGAAYIAMGLEETGTGLYGWYNGENRRLLTEAELDSDRAAVLAWDRIGERCRLFAAHPGYTVRFFGWKYLSQWGDPTKGSLREQELTGRHQEGLRPALADDLTFGTGYHIMQGVMHLFHLLLCYFSIHGMLSLIRGRRRLAGEAGLLLLFIFGGMLFHEIWEAAARYALRYEAAFLPFAAAGAADHLMRIRIGQKGIGKHEEQKTDRA